MELKYDIKICVNKLKFINDSKAKGFHDNFDEVYNLFLVKLGDLLDEYGVKEIDAELSPGYFLNKGNPTV